MVNNGNMAHGHIAKCTAFEKKVIGNLVAVFNSRKTSVAARKSTPKAPETNKDIFHKLERMETEVQHLRRTNTALQAQFKGGSSPSEFFTLPAAPTRATSSIVDTKVPKQSFVATSQAGTHTTAPQPKQPATWAQVLKRNLSTSRLNTYIYANLDADQTTLDKYSPLPPPIRPTAVCFKGKSRPNWRLRRKLRELLRATVLINVSYIGNVILEIMCNTEHPPNYATYCQNHVYRK